MFEHRCPAEIVEQDADLCCLAHFTPSYPKVFHRASVVPGKNLVHGLGLVPKGGGNFRGRLTRNGGFARRAAVRGAGTKCASDLSAVIRHAFEVLTMGSVRVVAAWAGSEPRIPLSGWP